MSEINWFPGHMAKALREIKEKQSIVDCFIVLLDSRVPLSSYNEDLDLIAPHKPRLFVFSKSDFCNLKRLKEIVPKFNNKQDKYVIVNLKKNESRTIILRQLNSLLEEKRKLDKQKGLLKPRLRCFVLGMPNVGKSTLINLIAGSKKTQVANFAGTTRALQWIAAGNIQLLDTPGILMPKLSNEELTIKLIATNLIKSNIISDKEFYFKVIDLLYKSCPNKFLELEIQYYSDEIEKYNEIVRYARKNNYFLKNKELDLNKAYSIIKMKILKLKNITWD